MYAAYVYLARVLGPNPPRPAPLAGQGPQPIDWNALRAWVRSAGRLLSAQESDRGDEAAGVHSRRVHPRGVPVAAC